DAPRARPRAQSGRGSRARSAKAATTCPGVTATAFEAFATIGGRPPASMAGKVISVAPPAMALAAPPASPAPNRSAAMPISIDPPYQKDRATGRLQQVNARQRTSQESSTSWDRGTGHAFD